MRFALLYIKEYVKYLGSRMTVLNLFREKPEVCQNCVRILDFGISGSLTGVSSN